MIRRQPERSDAFESIEDWMKRRNAEVGALRAPIVSPPQPKSPSRPSNGAVSRQPQRPMARPAGALQQGVDQVLAGARGAQDAFTFGVGDRAYAGGRALIDAAHGADLGAAYRNRMAAERARDRYDARHYAVARTVGQVVGTGAQIAALGPMEGLAAGGVRIAQASPLIAREVAALAGAGAVGGVGGQIISDVSHGHLGTPGDYGGAAVGGLVGALAARTGRAGHAGALMGATTSLAQDVLNHELSVGSIGKARGAASFGAILGAAGGIAGRRWSDSLSRKEKELLGEDFSRLRTRARGDETGAGRKTQEQLTKSYTIPDQRSFRDGVARDIIESKFGRRARLSTNQLRAFREIPTYRVDHILPRDIGVMFGLPAADFGQAFQSE